MTDALRVRLADRLREMFDANRIVAWHDDSGFVGDLLRAALPEGVRMPEFKGNPLSLRKVIDQDDEWLEHKWLLYVPRLPDLPEGQRCAWLADFEQGFCHVDGNVEWLLRNLFDLSGALDPPNVLRSDAARPLLEHFGALFPDNPERLQREDLYLALLRAAVGMPAATEPDLVIAYLTDAQDQRRLSELGLLPALRGIIMGRLGLTRRMAGDGPPDPGELCRCLVAAALVEADAVDAKALSNQLPQEQYRARWAKALVDALRSDSGPALRHAVRTALDGSKLALSLTEPMRLAHAPGLLFVDLRLLELLREGRPPEGDSGMAAWWQRVDAVADERLGQAGVEERAQAWWMALRAAARLLDKTQSRHRDLEQYPTDCFERLAQEYVAAEGDWQIDRLFHELPGPELRLPEWDTILLVPARQAYHRWTRELAERFVAGLEQRQAYRAKGFLRQTEFWAEMVERAEGRVAVLLVDALRTDLAYALREDLAGKHREAIMRPALAELPTRTEVGMAALLPGAEALTVAVEGGKLVARIGDERVRNAPERAKRLEVSLGSRGKTVRRMPLGDFLRNDAEALREALTDGALPVAYTTDVDEEGPVAASVESFVQIARVVEQCAAFVDQALALGCSEVLVAADHGFLVRDPDAAELAVTGTESAAGGFARGVRYAAGRGATGNLIGLPPKILGREAVEVFVPRDTACVAIQGGAGPFVHGGLSPQECALVFLRVLPGTGRAVARMTAVRLDVPARATSLSFRVELVVEVSREPLLVTQRRVQVVVHDARGAPAFHGDPVSLRAMQQEQTHAVVVTLGAGGEYNVLLNDVDTGMTLASRHIEVKVLGDDFGL